MSLLLSEKLADCNDNIPDESIPFPLISIFVSGQLKPASNGHFLEPKTSHPQ
jgi:hypothetical protein